MKTFIQSGAVLALIAPYAVASGGGALVGSIFGVAVNTVANAAEGEFAVTGVHDLAKATGAVTQGALIYWDNTNKVVTTTSSGNKLIGVAAAAALSGDATARVRLNGAFVS